jgi:hypothetical protein
MKYWAFCEGNNGDFAACLKNSVNICVDWIYKIRSLGGGGYSGTSILYIGQAVPRTKSLRAYGW